MRSTEPIVTDSTQTALWWSATPRRALRGNWATISKVIWCSR